MKNPSASRSRTWLAASFAHKGQLEDAQWEADQVTSDVTDFCLCRFIEAHPFRNKSDEDHFIEGLKLAVFE